MSEFQYILDLIRDKKLAEANDLIAPILEESPKNAEAWHCLGCLQQTRGDKQWAVESYKKAFEIEPNHTRALYNYATLLRRHPDVEVATKSRKAFKKVKKIQPDAIIPAAVYMGFPHYGSSDPRFEESLIQMMALVNNYYPDIDMMQCRCEGSRISSNRNRLMADARAKGATHILFIDTDMDYPVDALVRLLSHNKEIVGATTCKRGDEDGIPIGQALDDEGTAVKELKSGGELVEMVAFGCCFMLINMDVFDNIKLPAFYEPPNHEIEDAWGEDITFCKLARDAGYRIWMDFDLSIQLGHWGRKRYHIKPAKEKLGLPDWNNPQ